MARVIDSKIEKEISKGLKLNYATNNPLNSYILPKFEKNTKGEYVFVGNCTISTIQEYNKYIKTYRAIETVLKQTYKPVIAKIYKNALNSLIADNSKFRIEENDYSLSSKLSEKPFTLENLQDNLASAYKQTLNFVTKAAFKSKRLKPCAEINNILKANDKELNEFSTISVLPVMTDNGVVITHKPHNKTSIEAHFETVSKEDAKMIKEYLMAATEGLDSESARQINAKIEKMFKEASNIGESIKAGLNNNLHSRLEKLTVEFADLIGVDLSTYSKTPKNEQKNDTKKQEPSTMPIEEPVAEIDYKTPNNFEAKEILMNGTYKTSPAIEDGKIVTKISPEGLSFSVVFKNNKLFISNMETDDELGK